MVGDIALKPMEYLNKVDDVVEKILKIVPNANKIIINGIERIGKTVKNFILISKVRQTFYNASVRAKGIVADIFGKAKKADVDRPHPKHSGNTVRKKLENEPNYTIEALDKNGNVTGHEYNRPSGSTIPDALTKAYSIEVKNYDLSTKANKNNLLNTLKKQLNYRQDVLKESTKYKNATQYVVLDIRGQNIPAKELTSLMNEIRRLFDFPVGVRLIQ